MKRKERRRRRRVCLLVYEVWCTHNGKFEEFAFDNQCNSDDRANMLFKEEIIRVAFVL